MRDATDQPERTGTGGQADSRVSTADSPAAFEHRLVEARRAYAREVATLETIDETVMRSVRTSVVILGFVSSAVGVAGPEAVAALSVGVRVAVTLGVCALLAATLRGLGVTTVMERPSGPLPGQGSPFPERPVGGERADPVATRALLEEYATMTRTVEGAVDAHASGLARVHRLLAGGIVSLSVAAGSVVLSAGDGVDGTLAAVGLGLAVLLVALAGDDLCALQRSARS